MDYSPFSLILLKQALVYLLCSAVGAVFWAPVLIKILRALKITRRSEYDFTLRGERASKVGTPVMGGLLVVVTVTIITLLFNWQRKYTYVPIGAMAISALLGAADDLLNIFGKERRIRKIGHVLNLIKVHKSWKARLWYAVTFPWTMITRVVGMFGSHPGRGILVHEKLLLQFLAGAVVAWWIYWKLDPHWHSLWIPFDGRVALGAFIIPVIIFFVMFTANAVNIADGLDGLAGGCLTATFAGLTIISWADGRTAFTPLNAAVTGALIAYTFFNIKPARFQMGDVGSLGLGTLFAVNAVAIDRALLIPILGFIFYLEIAAVILQVLFRRLLGRRFLKMAPLHHHLEFKGWSEEKIVTRFWLLHLLAVTAAVWIALN